MATITKVGEKFRAQIRMAGHPSMAKTFDTEKEAKKWARDNEKEIDDGNKIGASGKVGMSIKEACFKFIEANPKLSRMAVNVVKRLANDTKLGAVQLHKLTDDHIVTYIKEQSFAPSTGQLHFSFLGSVLSLAKDGWKYRVPNIIPETRKRLKKLKLIANSTERKRRLSPEEEAMLLDYDFPCVIPMHDIIRIALCTGMRQAEITRICHATTDLEFRNIAGQEKKQATTLIKDRKHPTKKEGNDQTVPLLPEVIEIIKRQPKKPGDDRIFPYLPGSVGNAFTAACKALGIQDLHFHDLRHEAISRLFEKGYQIHEVALFSGHSDWKMLKRYTHLKAEDLRHLDAPAVEVKEEPVKAVEGGFDIEALKNELRAELKREMMAKLLGQTEMA